MTAPPPLPPLASRVKEVALVFARIGFTGFGGPPAHLAMMEDEIVMRRGWVDRQHFLDMVAALNFVPGPNSTELAMHLGLIRAGYAGLLVAGVSFVSPAMLMILPLAYLYVKGGSLPQVSAVMGGINAAVIAILIAATIRFAKAAIIDGFTAIVAVFSATAGFVAWMKWPQFQPELAILASAAVLGAIYYGRPRMPRNMIASVVSLAPSPYWSQILRMAPFLLKVGATLFGSGYVLVSYLQSGLVDHYHWLSKQELLDAISIGQVTPGPLLTTATFVGFVLGAKQFGGGAAGGVIGGIIATAAIFMPAFLIIAILAQVLPRIRANRFARGALTAMNAVVAALIFVVSWKLGAAALAPHHHVDAISIALAGVALLLILRFGVNPTWLIIGGAAVGLLRML